MAPKFIRAVAALELEEKILNGSALASLLFVFFPWVSGEWLGGESISYSGFGFYTSFIGLMVFLLQLFLLAVTLLPLSGGPSLLKKRFKEYIRLSIAGLATVLCLAALSVLMKVTFEFSRMEVRLGVYLTFVACFVSAIYAFIKLQDYRRSLGQELFRHPEDRMPEKKELVIPPPPPPPPAPAAPEEHRLYP